MKLAIIFFILTILLFGFGFYSFYIAQSHSHIANRITICAYYPTLDKQCSCLEDVENLFPKFNFGKSLEAERLWKEDYNEMCGRELDGLYITSGNESETNNLAREEDSKGDWVCINVRGMDYKRALEVCSHEVGHEIFAEKCESNPTSCFELMEEKSK